jgi:phosphoribosylformimino-5-aminoimidazole carboxamide ribotide isomerase
MEVIPAIDLMNGGCVRLFKGDFEQVTEYDQDPLDIATRYYDAGSARLHLVDLDGARSGELVNLDVIRRITSELTLKVQVGGGIRDLARVKLLLDAGADRVVIGSTAVQHPENVAEWIREVGGERIVLAFDVFIDANGLPVPQTHGWTEAGDKSLWDLLDFFSANGGIHYLCTDIDKDGTLEGPNFELYAECSNRYPNAKFIASGGVASAADLPKLKDTGAAGVVTGKALLDGRLTLEEIQSFSQNG